VYTTSGSALFFCFVVDEELAQALVEFGIDRDFAE